MIFDNNNVSSLKYLGMNLRAQWSCSAQRINNSLFILPCIQHNNYALLMQRITMKLIVYFMEYRMINDLYCKNSLV